MTDHDRHEFKSSPAGNCQCGELPLAECHGTNHDQRREAVEKAWTRLTNDTAYCEADDPEDHAVAYGILEDLAREAVHAEHLANEESNGAKLREFRDSLKTVETDQTYGEDVAAYALAKRIQLDAILNGEADDE